LQNPLVLNNDEEDAYKEIDYNNNKNKKACKHLLLKGLKILV